MSVGLGVLGGIVAFLCVEKLVRIMKVGSTLAEVRKKASSCREVTVILTALLLLQWRKRNQSHPRKRKPKKVMEKKTRRRRTKRL